MLACKLPLGVVWALVWLLVSTGAVAQSFYVAVTGSDTLGDGSRENPWSSISFAIDQVGDGATIEVGPGTYNGRVRLDQQFQSEVVVRSNPLYQARLRHNNGAAVICFSCQNITMEGFDIAHTPDNNLGLLIQIQSAEARFVTLRNNIIHDSTDNDLLKINNGTRDILVQGNMFYNQAGSDEHIDINSVDNVAVLDNVFFNTSPQTETSSYIVIKDSNGNSDNQLGARNIDVRRNIFLNWQGSSGQSFVRVGEDGTSNFEAQNVLIENNLMLGNSHALIRSALTIQGSRNVRFQFNTVVGDLPSRSFAARLLTTGANQPNTDIVLANNIWSDPTGTMGAEAFNGADVFDAPIGSNASVTLTSNLYYNAGAEIPTDTAQQINLGDDPNPLIADPILPEQVSLVLPVFNGAEFGGGFASVRDVFVSFANRFGRPAITSPVINAARSTTSPEEDLLGQLRDVQPDLGAVEVIAAETPPSRPRNLNILAWLLLLLE